MIKISFIIDTIKTPAAGTERQLLMLLDGLDRKLFSPRLICLRNSDWLKTQEFQFPVERYNLRKMLSLSTIKRIRQFIRFTKKEQPDIIQTFFVDANIFGVIAARLAGCKIIISSRRSLGQGYSRLNLLFLRLLRRWTTSYLANSEAAALKTVDKEGVPRHRITVIYNGLDLQQYRSISPEQRSQQRREWRIDNNETLIGVVANLRDIKNIDSLIRVAARLDNEFPSLKYVVVGEGPERPKLQNLIESSGLAGRFLLVGSYPDVVPCLAAFDIAVMCSSFESFSNSLIEYMAAGLPIISSDAGGNSEAISHNENGLLYPVGDEQGLENGLRKLFSDQSLATRLGESARKTAFRCFSREAYIKRHEDYYIQLVRSRSIETIRPVGKTDNLAGTCWRALLR